MSSIVRQKSETDRFWDERAIKESDKDLVNIADLAQRQIEDDFILKYLDKNDEVLEIGCGNGILTAEIRALTKHVDAFDFSESMIETAKKMRGETNNSFYHEDLVHPQHTNKRYDAIICVRVLINLKNIEEQVAAIHNMKTWLKPNGKLILIEGYSEGFEQLNDLRAKALMKPLKGAAINYYSPLEEIMPVLEKSFKVNDRMHTGIFDYLTRIVYPAIVGEEKATGYSEFHRQILPLAKAFNPDCMQHLARLHGFQLTPKAV